MIFFLTIIIWIHYFSHLFFGYLVLLNFCGCEKNLNMIVEIEDGQEEATIEKILSELAREIHGNVGRRMHQLNECEWEVKLWVASNGPANGAWTILYTNVNGHTCVALVYRELDDNTIHQMIYQSIQPQGPLHGRLVSGQYQPGLRLF